MAIEAYANVQLVANVNTISDWMNYTNQIMNDLATVVVTTSNTGLTVAEGSFQITETFGANNAFFTNGIRGGNANTSAELTIFSNVTSTSNATFGNISASNTVYANNVVLGNGYFQSNTVYVISKLSGGSEASPSTLNIDGNANVSATFTAESLIVNGNTSLTGDVGYSNGIVTFAGDVNVEFENLIESTKLLGKTIDITGNTSPITIDITEASTFVLTLEDDTVLNFDASGLSSTSSDQTYTFAIKVIQDASASQYILDLSNNTVDYPYGITPVLSTGANRYDYLIIQTLDQGNTYTLFISGQDF